MTVPQYALTGSMQLSAEAECYEFAGHGPELSDFAAERP